MYICEKCDTVVNDTGQTNVCVIVYRGTYRG